jgi:hypothetical protein
MWKRVWSRARLIQGPVRGYRHVLCEVVSARTKRVTQRKGKWTNRRDDQELKYTGLGEGEKQDTC